MAKKLWMNGIVAFVIYLVMFAASFILLVGYGMLGLAVSIALLAASVFLVWKLFRRDSSVEQTKKALWSLAKIWPIIPVVLALLYIFVPWLASLAGFEPVPCPDYYEPCIDCEPCDGDNCIMYAMRSLCGAPQQFFGAFVIMALLYIPYIILVRFIGPLFG